VRSGTTNLGQEVGGQRSEVTPSQRNGLFTCRETHLCDDEEEEEQEQGEEEEEAVRTVAM